MTCSAARGEIFGGDDRERCGLLTGGAYRLEYSLGEERHQAIAATFWTCLHLDGVRDPPPSD